MNNGAPAHERDGFLRRILIRRSIQCIMFDRSVQRLAKVSAPGLVESVSAVSYYFCLNMPASFMQPRALKISVPGL